MTEYEGAVEKARQAGYSDGEIVDFLAPKLDFNVGAARESGYADKDILGALLNAPKSGTLRRVADVGISALKSTIAVPEIAVGLADIVTGGYAGKAAESLGFRPREAKEFLDEYLSPEQRAANKRVAETKGFLPTLGALARDPSVIGHTAVESIAPMLAGGVVARGALAARGILQPTLNQAIGAGAMGEGVVGAGLAAEQIRQASPEGTLNARGAISALGSGAGTALFGAVGGGLARKLKIIDIDTALAQGTLAGPAGASGKGFLRRLVEGGVSEGGFEELPQSAQEQMWQNYATGKPIMEGVPEASAMGLVVGAAMGGPVSAIFGGMGSLPRSDDEFAAAEAVTRISHAGNIDEAVAAMVTAVDTPLPSAPIALLPPPVLEATPFGEVGTRAQFQQSRQSAQEELDQLGLTPDVLRVQGARFDTEPSAMQRAFERARQRAPESAQSPSDVRIFGELLTEASDAGLADAAERHPMSAFREAARLELSNRARLVTDDATLPDHEAQAQAAATEVLNEAASAEYWQWKRNAQGGQTFGNRQTIEAITPETFEQHIAPRVARKLRDFTAWRTANPGATHVSLIERDDGKVLPGSPFVGTIEQLRPTGGAARMAVQVQSFDAPQAIKHGAASDLEAMLLGLPIFEFSDDKLQFAVKHSSPALRRLIKNEIAARARAALASPPAQVATILGKPVTKMSPEVLAFVKMNGSNEARAIAIAESERRESVEREKAEARQRQHSLIEARRELDDTPSRQFLRKIVELGGINSDLALDIAGDKGVRGLGGMAARVFRKQERAKNGSNIVAGHSIDDVVLFLVEAGWIPWPVYEETTDGGVQLLKDMTREAIDGQLQPMAEETAAQENVPALAEQEIEVVDLAAKAVEIDPDGFERLAIQYDGRSDDDFSAALKEFLNEHQRQNARVDTDRQKDSRESPRPEAPAVADQGPGQVEQPRSAYRDDRTGSLFGESGQQETPETAQRREDRAIADRERDLFALTQPAGATTAQPLNDERNQRELAPANPAQDGNADASGAAWWNRLTEQQRLDAAMKAGWSTANNTPNFVAKKLAKQSWGEIVDETRQTLLRKNGVALREPMQEYNPAQLDLIYDNAETRPGTTDGQRATGVAALRALFGRDRRAGATLLGSNLWRDFVERKGADLIGQPAGNPGELALLAQVLRDPRFETMRFFFVKGDMVVGHTGVTSRLPGMVAFGDNQSLDVFLNEAKGMMGRLEADGYWMLHNHPNGVSKPSTADISLTRKMSDSLPGMRGHVVIDHDEYSFISRDGKTQGHGLPATPKPTAELAHDALSKEITSPMGLAAVAKILQRKDGFAVVVSTTAPGRVAAIAEIPETLLTNKTPMGKMRAVARLRRFMNMTGASGKVFVVSDNPGAYAGLIRAGVVGDAIAFGRDDYSVLQRNPSLPLHNIIKEQNQRRAGTLRAEQTREGRDGLFSRARTNIDTAMRRMARFVDEYVAGSLKDNDTQILGPTPTVLQALGAEALSLHIDGATVNKVLAGKHSFFMTPGLMKQLPEAIYDPLMVFNSPADGVDGKMLLTELSDKLGNPVIVAVHLSRASGRLNVNNIASAYGMDSAKSRLMNRAGALEYFRNEQSLAPSTTPGQLNLPDVVQAARDSGAILKTEADVVKERGGMFSRAADIQRRMESAHPRMNIGLTEYPNGYVEVDLFELRDPDADEGGGYARRAMQDLTAWLDREGRLSGLTALPASRKGDESLTQEQRDAVHAERLETLARFYERNGWVKDDGQQYSNGYIMTRHAKQAETAATASRQEGTQQVGVRRDGARGPTQEVGTGQAPSGQEGALSQAPGRGLSASTVESVTDELTAKIGKTKASRVRIAQSWQELPERGRRLVFSRKAFDVQGYFDPETNTAWLIADNIRPGEAFAVLMHEVGVHMGMDADTVKRLSNQVRLWAQGRGDAEHFKIAKRAMARIPKDTPAADRDQEAVAYFTEEAVRAGHGIPKPSEQGPIARWFRQLLAAVKVALRKLGADPEVLTTDDIVALARGALERALAGGKVDQVSRATMDGMPQKRLGPEYVYHNTSSAALGPIMRDGVNAGSFTGRPIDFGGDAWIAIKRTDLPEFQEHDYGGVAALEPAWEAGDPDNPRVVTPDKIIVVDKRGRPISKQPGPPSEGRTASGTPSGLASQAGRDRGNIDTALRRMARFVDEHIAGRLRDSDTQIIGPTPVTLQVVGAPALDLQIDGATVKKIVSGKHHHTMTAESLKQLPESLYDPLAVFANPGADGETNLMVLTEQRDRLGNNVVSVVHLARRAGRMVINDVATAFGMDNAKKTLGERRLLYYRNDSSLMPLTTPAMEVLAGVVQAARDSGTILKTEADVVNERGGMFSRAGWIDQQPADTQEALRKAGVWHVPPTLKARVEAWSTDWQQRLKQGVVDQFDPIKRYDYHAYMLARMTRGTDNALDALLNYGTVFLDQDGAIDVNFEQGGFLGIMSKLNGEHDRFLAWVIANRAERLKGEGREHNFTDQDIARLKALNQGKMTDGSSRVQEYERARAALDRYNKAVLDIAEKAGLIDGASRSAWEKDFYVPFYRLMEDEAGKQKGPIPSKGLVNQYAFKVLKGDGQALGDPMENILKNWSHLLDASLKNQASRESLLAAERIGAAVEGSEETVRQMAKAAGLKDAVVSFTDQGGQRWFMLEDPFLLDALKGIGFSGFQGPAMKVMQNFKRWLTIGVTISPTFRIRNVIRDSLQMIGANPASYNVLGNVLTGWKATKEGPEYASILAGGGVMRFGTVLDGDRAAHVKRLIESGVDDRTILTTPDRVKDALQQARDWWQRVGDRAENVNRAALYKKLRSEGKTHLEASFAARDTMDFSMQGTWASIRFLSQTVPFFNARLQGLYKLGRGAAEDPRRFGIVVGAATLASLALLMAYGDDDDWKQREDWDRETFWWFKIGDKAFRIPKPFEIGAISTIAERAAEAMFTDELTGKQFAERMFNIVSQQLSMNPVPQMAMPLIELYANRDSFTDRPIEGMGMERLSKPMRAGPHTSATAQLLGKNGVVSPVQIDHLVQGYFGWLGAHIVSTADLALRPAMGLPGNPAWRVDEVLVAGDFVRDMPAYQSKYVTRMYDQMEKVQQAMADLKHLQKAGAIDEARELLDEKKDTFKLVGIYRAADRQLIVINARIKMTQARQGDPDEKRAQLDALYAARNRVARITSERAASLQR